jgi:hypothetical protein
MPVRSARRQVALLVSCAGLAGLVGLGGCGSAARTRSPITSAGPTATTATTAGTTARPSPVSAAACGSAAQVQTSLTDVARLDPATAGGGGVRVALQHLDTAASSLGNQAPAQFGPEVATLRQKIGRLQSTVTGLAHHQADAMAKLGTVSSEVGDVEAAAQVIVVKARGLCPLPAVTPRATATS